MSTADVSTRLVARPRAQQQKTRALRLTLNGALWILQVSTGFFFAGSGFGKVLLVDPVLYADAPRIVAWFAAVPQPLIVAIGVCEVLGGIGLILPAMTKVRPRLTPLAAACLAVTMVLAAGFHIVRSELELVPVPLVLAGATAFIAVGRWKLRPQAPAPPTASSVIKTVAVLALLVALAFAPTWSTMHDIA